MKYKKLSIRNFKGINEVEIDFSNNRILTLVGLNESGKTTILDAINIFYRLIKDQDLLPKELNEIRPKGIDFTGDIVLSGTLELEEDDYTLLNDYLKTNNKKSKLNYPKEFIYSYKFKYELHTYVDTTRNVTFPAKSSASKNSLHETNYTLWLELVKYIRLSLVPEVLYYEDFVFEIPDKILFSINAEQTGDIINEWRLVLNDILKTVSPKFSSFQDNVVNIWKTDNDVARQRLSAMEKQLDKKITRAWKELFNEKDNKQNERLNFKEIKLIPISEDADEISFSFKVKTDSGKEFSINERSKGCKWFFSFLIFTEFRKNRTKNILFLLDEPASNLHSSAQLKILNAIESLSDKSVIVYSTHSHHLINTKWLNGAYIVINEGMSDSNLEGALTDTDAKITIERYYSYVSNKKQEVQTLYFQPILDSLDYKPSFLEPIPAITICEGKYDWITYKYINEVVLKNKYKLNFYPGKGANSSNLDIVRLYLAWGSQFLMILDGDKSGIEAKKMFIDEIGGMIEKRVFTYNDILNKRIVTEDIFSDTDKRQICNTAFGGGSYENVKGNDKKRKSTVNFALAQLLNNKEVVPLEKSTLDLFEVLFSFIQEKI